MTRRGLIVAALSLGIMVGCTESTAVDTRISAVRVENLVDLYGVGFPNTEVADLPAIKVIDVSSGQAIAGRPVVFTLESPDGSKTTVTGSTGADGIARLTSWRLGSQVGRYAVTAVTDGWGPVIFSVIVPGRITATYDLKSINGIPIAVGREVHYVLYESGLYNVFVHRPDQPFTTADGILGTYAQPDSSRIVFHMGCGRTLGQCFVRNETATVSGAEMIIDESDFLGPWIELHVLR